MATPIIPAIKQTHAKNFPAKSKIDLSLSLVTNETNKNIAERIEKIHAIVTKVRAAKILLHELVPLEHVTSLFE